MDQLIMKLILIDGKILQYKFIKYKIFQLMNETPYQLKLRKEKQRKMNLFKNIETKDLRKRSINYNIGHHQTQEENPQTLAKIQLKEQNNQININNSIKKSFYYRKMLNKTIDHQITYEYYRKVKEQFDKLDKNTIDKEGKNYSYSKIWEKQFKKYENEDEKSDENILQIISKNVERNGVNEGSQGKIQKRKKVQDIMQIAQQRKNQLTFQLEILGNKKSIRIKNCPIKSNPNNQNSISSQITTKNLANRKDQIKNHHKINSEAAEIKQKQKRQESNEKNQCINQNKKYNLFLKTISERNNALMKKQELNNNLLKVTKLADQSTVPDFLLNLNQKRIKSIKNRIQQAEKQYIQIQSDREIKTKQRKRYSMCKFLQRQNKPETSYQTRSKIIQNNKIHLNHLNDIKGWFVGHQIEDQLQSFYQI